MLDLYGCGIVKFSIILRYLFYFGIEISKNLCFFLYMNNDNEIWYWCVGRV